MISFILSWILIGSLILNYYWFSYYQSWCFKINTGSEDKLPSLNTKTGIVVMISVLLGPILIFFR